LAAINKVGEISGTGVDYRQFMEQVDVAQRKLRAKPVKLITGKFKHE
jgi:hypothetical protein